MTERIHEQFYRNMRDLERRVNSRNEYASMHTGTAVPDHTAAEGVFYWDTAGDDLYVNIDGATAWQFIAGGGGAAHHQILSATHTDSTAAAVQRGDIISGQGTATITWQRLAHPSAAGYALTTDADDVAWNLAPTWTGDHTWDDGAGDSPALVLVGGSNDDTAQIYLLDDAVAGNSDLVVQLVANDDDARLIVEQLGGTDIAYVSGTGNLWIEGDVMLTDDAFVGISGGGRLIFDATPAPDQIDVTDADLYFATAAHGIIHVDGVAAGSILVADGTRYIPATTLPVGTLPAHTHAGAGQGGSLVVGTTDTDATAGSVFFAGAAGVIQEDNAGLFWDDGNNRLGIGTSTPGNTLHVDQSNASGAQPVLYLDQGDESEQHIVVTMGGADVDMPAILQVEVTGTPTLWWDESEDAFSLTKDIILEQRCFGFLKAQNESGRVGNGPVETGETVAVCGYMYVAPGAALFQAVTIN